MDARWGVTDYNWTGTEYEFVTQEQQAAVTGPRKGERPVIAFLGGSSSSLGQDTVALQFAQQAGEGGGGWRCMWICPA